LGHLTAFGRWDSIGSWIARNRTAAAGITVALSQLVNELRSEGPVVVLASGHAVALALLAGGWDRFVFECADSMGLHYKRRVRALGVRSPLKALNSWRVSAWFAGLEAYVTRRASMTLVCSPHDASFIRSRCCGGVVRDIRNGTDWLSFEAHVVRQEPGKTLAFFGQMQWEPNRLTALYLARELMPALRRICPSAELRIIGGPRIPQLQICDGKHGVRVLGFVEDLPAAVRRCDVFVMPMFAGSGVKNKLAEAMALGMPVVTNSFGAEALPGPARAGVLVCDGDEDLTHGIADLLVRAERRAVLGQRARVVAKQVFDWQTIREQFKGAVLEAIDGPGDRCGHIGVSGACSG